MDAHRDAHDMEEVDPRTSKATLQRGAILNEGVKSAFWNLKAKSGEKFILRLELSPKEILASEIGRQLARIVHITDFQLADVKSPTRLEFMDRQRSDVRLRDFIPSYRPQEPFIYYMVLALVRTINNLDPSERFSSRVSVVVTSGDLIDNAQQNEMSWVLKILGGGQVELPSGQQEFEFVSSLSFGDDYYWKPQGSGDFYQVQYGYPRVDGLLEVSILPFLSEGLGCKWLGCNGNHEMLTQGIGRVDGRMSEISTSEHKSIDLPYELGLDPYSSFVDNPSAFFENAVHKSVATDEGRAHQDRRGVVQAYLDAPGEPTGHGFSTWNLETNTAYYSYDLNPDVRIITLDTAIAGKGAQGAVDRAQFEWLSEKLEEVSTRKYLDGRWQQSSHERDAYVIITSHHPVSQMAESIDDEQMVNPEELVALFHRFPNVILWLAGHTHVNKITPFYSPHGSEYGFWHVTTSSIMDWPCQFRDIEIFECEDGDLEITLEMCNVGVPTSPHRAKDNASWVASWHRLVAYNTSLNRLAYLEGHRHDRNVVLRLSKRH